MTKTIDTLLEDMDALYSNPNHEVSDDNVEIFGRNVKKLLKESIEEAGNPRDFTVRMSNYGTPYRKLWYESKRTKEDAVDISPSTYRKFLFGHILEELLLFYIREAGHKLEKEQAEIEVNGVLGHMDAVIDDSVVDIKSASTFSFGKFKNRALLAPGNDPFGYRAQISGYAEALGKDKGYFLVIDKQHGELTLLCLDEFDLINSSDRIDHIRKILVEDTPPEEKCYEPKVHDNGNKELPKSCTYCRAKELCWKDTNDGAGIRWFEYSNGPRGLVEVMKLPRVTEITF